MKLQFLPKFVSCTYVTLCGLNISQNSGKKLSSEKSISVSRFKFALLAALIVHKICCFQRVWQICVANLKFDTSKLPRRQMKCVYSKVPNQKRKTDELISEYLSVNSNQVQK